MRRAQIALAWLRRNPVVVAPIVGASKPSHIDDAVASFELELTDEEASRLEAPYTPRHDFQGTSDDTALARISARFGINPAGSYRNRRPGSGAYSRDPLYWSDENLDAVDDFPPLRGTRAPLMTRLPPDRGRIRRPESGEC